MAGGRRAERATARQRGGESRNKKMLEDGERLLRAERFPEARAIFERLTKSKRDRGPALARLAEISFQEKNAAQAVRSPNRRSTMVAASRPASCWATRTSGWRTTMKPPRPTKTR